MKRRLFLFASLASASPVAAQQPRAEAELIRLEQDYARALVNKDLAFLRSFYAPDWRGGNWLGFFTKSTLLKRLQGSRYVIKSMVVRDLRVRVLGNVAIVQGVDEEVTAMGDRNTSGTWGFTDIFARRGGRWVAIASQTTRIGGDR
ncbi:nuclear transport factor 2 family protein [Sphingomonas sp. ID1715]|uniref:nuclear transport factor 2 family protein n=1 Tax=Sphingomonas sp. ID1715 TaxID=1656898 RepID=UPI001487DCAB|nr:nuclear transport factor 2 family protein [Sphingomonas sp. ID1715]NNM75979.1 nuclear transport factor 2 family protein [Sphingomonas sp. ID1715]